MALYVSTETVQRLVMTDHRGHTYTTHMLHMLQEWTKPSDPMVRFLLCFVHSGTIPMVICAVAWRTKLAARPCCLGFASCSARCNTALQDTVPRTSVRASAC